VVTSKASALRVDKIRAAVWDRIDTDKKDFWAHFNMLQLKKTSIRARSMRQHVMVVLAPAHRSTRARRLSTCFRQRMSKLVPLVTEANDKSSNHL
jgi:hypothetical protein